MSIEVLSDQRSVLLNGAELTVGARAFDVLSFLFDHSDRVVSKEELMNHVWSDAMVEESNLTVQIASLRKALGKDVIKTVPGVGYRFIQASDATNKNTSHQPTLASPNIPSLAVLPFTNFTGSADREYLVDGIVNDVISALSRVSSFFVISSTSSFTYKGRSVELAEVGRELGVRYVLEGSIQQSGDRMRISTNLVEAETGHMIWQDRFEGMTDEIFELQDRVAEQVAGALEPKLIWAEAAHARTKPTESLEAYDLCMQASPKIYRLNRLSDLEEGLVLLKQALELDPSYIYAKAMVCFAHSGAFAARWWSFEKAQAALPLAREVLDASPDDPLALAYAGHYLAYVSKAHQEGLTALKRAYALNPNSATVALLLGWVHNYMAENDEAIAHLLRVQKISPLHPNIGVATCGIGNALLQKGEFEDAAKYYEQAMAEYPEFASIHLGLMGCYWHLGRFEDSARIAKWFRTKVPDMSVSTFVQTRPQNSEYYRDTVIAALKGNGFPD
jgi:TolB-like protein/thioredoxin-like negative regulator of GroEL